MIVVGELINASRKAIAAAIEAQDVDAIQNIAREQVEAGADYIDVNAGVFVGKEAQYLTWLVEVVQTAVDVPCCIDSPDPNAIEAALAVHRGTAMINSISSEKERLETLLPIVGGTELKIVALCMSDEGMPETAAQRMAIAEPLINRLLQRNIPVGNIYVDPLVQPVSTNDVFGKEFLNAIEAITTHFEGIHTMCGLSNISYGLPERKLLNQTFAAMALARGLDGLIINPLDRRMMATLYAANALAGNDEWCSAYLDAYRSEKLKV
jgi:5-methyltetrahydrofolate--homocysteine methyltransferase